MIGKLLFSQGSARATSLLHLQTVTAWSKKQKAACSLFILPPSITGCLSVSILSWLLGALISCILVNGVRLPSNQSPESLLCTIEKWSGTKLVKKNKKQKTNYNFFQPFWLSSKTGGRDKTRSNYGAMSQRSLGKWLPKLVSSSKRGRIKPKNGVSNLPLINASCCRADSGRPRCQVYVLAASSDWQSDLLLDETHLLTGAVFSPLCLAVGSCLPRGTWWGWGTLLRLSFMAGGRKRIKATEKEQGRERLAS